MLEASVDSVVNNSIGGEVTFSSDSSVTTDRASLSLWVIRTKETDAFVTSGEGGQTGSRWVIT